VARTGRRSAHGRIGLQIKGAPTEAEHTQFTEARERNYHSEPVYSLACNHASLLLLHLGGVGAPRARRDGHRHARGAAAAGQADRRQGRRPPAGGGRAAPAGQGGGHAGRRPELVVRCKWKQQQQWQRQRRARQGGRGGQEGGRQTGQELPHQGAVPQEEDHLRQGMHACGARQVRRQVLQVLRTHLLGCSSCRV
jgi:hypothetical protein